MKTLILVLILIPTLCFSREYQGLITSCHDGDTCYAIIQLGFGVKLEANVRLTGINAPELKTGKLGENSTEALKKIVLNKKVRIVTNDKCERDKYGRILATIFVEDLNVNEKMVKDGQAVVYNP